MSEQTTGREATVERRLVEETPELLPFQLTLRTGSESQRVEGAVPNAPMTLIDFLPLLWQLDQVIVSAAEREVEQGEHRISCTKGCGACCRQLVPIAQIEALHIARMVRDMPEPRRSQVEQRFEEAVAQLRAQGLLEGEWDSEALGTAQERRQYSYEYLRAGVACPFLVDESCSIHTVRPLVCREYLVVSDPASCKTATEVLQVPLPNVASSFLYRFDGGVRWRPLVLSLELDSDVPLPLYSGPSLVERLVIALGLPVSQLPTLGGHSPTSF